MENPSTTDNNNSEQEEGQKQETRQFNRSRGRTNRPYNDLRELLNQKRQNQSEIQGNGPPSEPRYNFLSDPLRDNDLDPKNKGNDEQDNYGSGRFSPRQHNTVTFQNRNRGGGRGRGRGNSYRKFEQPRHQGGDYRRNDEWREERNRVDKEQIQRQRSDSGGFKREWDAGKEDMWKDQPPNSSNKPQYSPQHRSTTSPHPHRRNKPAPQRRQDGADQPQQEQQHGSSNSSIDNNHEIKDGASPSSYSKASRKYNTDNNRGANQYRPPQKYNPNYNYRGQRNNFQKQLKPQRPNPMNITVAFSAETGQRTCTIEKSTQVERIRPQRNHREKRGIMNAAPVVDCEENWDDDILVNKQIKQHEEETNAENASALSDNNGDNNCVDRHDERAKQINGTNAEQCDEVTGPNDEPCDEVNNTNDERCDALIGDNGDGQYDAADDVNEEQYVEAEEGGNNESLAEKQNDNNVKEKSEGVKVKYDAGKKDDDTGRETSKKEDNNETENKESVNSNEQKVVADVTSKEEDKNESENKESIHSNEQKVESDVASKEELIKKEEDNSQIKEDSTNDIKNRDQENVNEIKEECNKENVEKNAEIKPDEAVDNKNAD